MRLRKCFEEAMEQIVSSQVTPSEIKIFQKHLWEITTFSIWD